jgi:serine protease Do
MKWVPPVLSLLSLLLLCGCHRSEPAPAPQAVTTAVDAAASSSSGSDSSSPVTAFTPETRHAVDSGDVPLLEQIDRENIKVANAVLPSVVRITAMTPIDPHAHYFGQFPFKLPFGSGTPHGVHPNVPSYGSGVIISRDGFIVTNYHVIDGAQSLEVELRDQRTFTARAVASDVPLDVAVLKIDAADLPALSWGDSDKVEVGQQVFAIGNPFNLEDSVTKGIVSAKGRTLSETDPKNYEDFIQTDAAINVGNSGGALVNVQGELVGINAAIASYTGLNEGVGFAIPSNLVRYAVEGLLKDGHLVRGYLGVRLPALVDDGVTELLGLDDSRGALLAGVQHPSPADAAKLRSADFITEIDGNRIENASRLRLVVSQIPIGKQVVVSYIRGGAPRSTTIKIAELPKDTSAPTAAAVAPEVAADTGVSKAPPTADDVLGGVQVTDLNDGTRQKFGIDDVVTSGVVVTSVAEGSPADAKGLLRGDVIEMACAQRGTIQPLTSQTDFAGVTRKLKADQSVVLLVHHGRTSGPEDRSSMFVCLSPQK